MWGRGIIFFMYICFMYLLLFVVYNEEPLLLLLRGTYDFSVVDRIADSPCLSLILSVSKPIVMVLLYRPRFHRERDEPTLPSDVLLPLRDDKQVSVDDYRNKLYSIMAKSAHAQARKMHTR